LGAALPKIDRNVVGGGIAPIIEDDCIAAVAAVERVVAGSTTDIIRTRTTDDTVVAGHAH
jgi:hypothetical protein